MSKTIFTRKSVDIEDVKRRSYREEAKCEYIIEKVIELPEKEYSAFASSLLVDNEIVKASRNLMYVDANEVWHCILVKALGSKDGILVEAEGYDYARYTAHFKGGAQS